MQAEVTHSGLDMFAGALPFLRDLVEARVGVSEGAAGGGGGGAGSRTFCLFERRLDEEGGCAVPCDGELACCAVAFLFLEDGV